MLAVVEKSQYGRNRRTLRYVASAEELPEFSLELLSAEDFEYTQDPRLPFLLSFGLLLQVHPDTDTCSCPQVFNCASDRYITYNGLFREVGKVWYDTAVL